MPSRRDYEFGPQLGRGSFGCVFKVHRKADGSRYVCKQIKLGGMSKRAREDTEQEVTLLRRISSGSEHIVQYVESFLEGECLHIVMEYCEHGDLGDHLKRRGKSLEEEMVWRLLLQVGLGLQWLHLNHILHRDIKAHNVFLTACDDARLGDLGVSRVLSDTADFASTLVGTPYYLSPELCEAKPYNDRSDVWAYGCVVYQMCTLRHPFDAKNQAALLVKIVRGSYAPVPAAYSAELRTLVAGCLEHDAARRPAVRELLAEEAAVAWGERVGVLVGRDPWSAEDSSDPEKASAGKRVRRLDSQISRLHDDAVRGLAEPVRLVWDGLYRFLRAKMAADLTEEDHKDIERHIFEELPTENTELISTAWRILHLEQECDHCRQILDA